MVVRKTILTCGKVRDRCIIDRRDIRPTVEKRGVALSQAIDF
jgi:hypothetical protein